MKRIKENSNKANYSKTGNTQGVLPVICLPKLLKINSVPVGLAWYNEVKATEEQVLSKRN